jgi:hypothetical protein
MTQRYLLLGKMSSAHRASLIFHNGKDEPRHRASLIFRNGKDISRFGIQIKLWRFGLFGTQKLYTSHVRRYIYADRLALDWPLLVYIACDILLGRISSNND